MARVLHTAVGDEIRKVAQTDPEQAAEMRAESIEYRNEVMGHYDYDEDPADRDDEPKEPPSMWDDEEEPNERT